MNSRITKSLLIKIFNILLEKLKILNIINENFLKSFARNVKNYIQNGETNIHQSFDI